MNPGATGESSHGSVAQRGRRRAAGDGVGPGAPRHADDVVREPVLLRSSGVRKGVPLPAGTPRPRLRRWDLRLVSLRPRSSTRAGEEAVRSDWVLLMLSFGSVSSLVLAAS